MKNIVENIKVKAIMCVDALKNAFNDIRENGLPTGLKLGLSNLDNLIRLDRGKVVAITGIPNHGKSEFVDYIVVQLNKLYGMKTLYFSPENQPIGLHLTKLFRKFTGKLPEDKSMSTEKANEVLDYICSNLFFFDYSQSYTIDNILSVAREAIQVLGVDILVIDSYNKMSAEVSAFETQVIGQVMDKIIYFAKQTNTLVILVVHPKKADKNSDGTYKMPTGYDMNGSANFLNKTDDCICVYRVFNPNHTIISCEKSKFSNYGGIGKTALGFDNMSTNYYDIDDTDLDTPIGIRDIPAPPAFIPFVIPEPQPVEAKVMTGYDYLNIEVSAFADKKSIVPKPVNLFTFLTSNKYVDKVEYIRGGATFEDIKKRKDATSLPSVTVSAIFEGGRSDDNFVTHTNLMCIDIDRKDNPDIIERIPDILKSLPYVAFFQKSVSGEGYYAIVPIEYGDKHLQHFLALEEEFATMGVTIDKSCKNISRLRFYSYDEDRYVAQTVRLYSNLKEAAPKSIHKSSPRLALPSGPASNINNKELTDELDVICKQVSENRVVVCPDYETWFQVGCSLANELGEGGRRYFQMLSEPYSGYDKAETDSKYDSCLDSCGRYSYTKGTLFHYINQALEK